MIQNFIELVIGSLDDFGLEHRCYNAGCIAASFGCLSAAIFNTILEIPIRITLVTMIIGIIYLWLYFKSRRSKFYRPVLWLYILSGVVLMIMTWIYNGGSYGSDTLVAMVALVAMTVVLRTRRFLMGLIVFIPTMSALFLVEFLYPEMILGYSSIEQRFFDIYVTFVVATVVILSIITIILQSHDNEKKRLEEALSEVETLGGLLPICSHCKKIRDDKGYWNQIEAYIQDHSKAEFSHGICQECAKKFYPDLDLYDDEKA